MKKHDHYHAHDSGAHQHEHDEHHHGAPFGRKVIFIGEDLTEQLAASIAEVRRRKSHEAASAAGDGENDGD